jgi:LacI family transcriptional regulator
VMNPFFTAVARAVEDAAREKGYSLILGNADEDIWKEEFYLNMLLERQVDGLIVSPARAESPHLTEIARRGIPLVFVDRYIESIRSPVIRADGRRAIKQLVEYLVELGHRKLAIISGPPQVVSGGERLDAFLGAAKEQGVPIAEDYIRIGNFRRQSGSEAMRELLELDSPPTVVFAANNLMTLGALQVIRKKGLKIPDDISLASFDDVTWFELLDPPVTAITQPTEELGATAAQMLLEMVEEGRQPESCAIEAKLVIRDSCGEPGRS